MAKQLAAAGCKVAIVDLDGNAAQTAAHELKAMNVDSAAYDVNFLNVFANDNLINVVY